MRRRLMVVLSCIVAGLMIMVPMLSAQSPRETSIHVAKAGMDTERLARIPARMKEFVEKGIIAGAVTLVARRGVVASLGAVGYQDLESKETMRIDTIFQVRSMTKPVTAVGTMILLEEGRLQLNDPVEKHLPEFKGIAVAESRQGDVARPTIRDLLTHTSGVVNGSWDLPEGPLRRRVEEAKSLAEQVASVAQYRLEFEPGTRYLYSDLGYDTLGRIIEVVAGQPYEQFVKERILEPLGMKDSSLLPPLDKLNRVASTYTRIEGKLVKWESHRDPTGSYPVDISSLKDQLKIPSPAWSLFSTASDMFAFYQMMLNGGAHGGRRILSSGSVEVMTHIHTGELMGQEGYKAKANAGLGWSVVGEPRETLRLTSIGAYGKGGLLGTYGWVDPKKELVGIFLIHRDPSDSPASQARHAFMAMAAAAIVD